MFSLVSENLSLDFLKCFLRAGRQCIPLLSRKLAKVLADYHRYQLRATSLLPHEADFAQNVLSVDDVLGHRVDLLDSHPLVLMNNKEQVSGVVRRRT